MDDFFAELEAEIATATAKNKLKSDAVELRKKANNMRLPSATRAAASAEFKSISAILEAEAWTAVSTVALFTEQTCDGCGSVHRVFLQYMQLEQMKKKPSTQRWTRVAKPHPTLPRESLIQPHHTHICEDCCEDHGFAIIGAARLPANQAIAPSLNYLQEDINAPAS